MQDPTVEKWTPGATLVTISITNNSNKNAMFSELQLGAMKLSHRVVMAPLTRTRGTDTFAPCATAAEYYAQRATNGGLLITEAVPISPETPYGYAPGIFTQEQELGWKKVVDAVHAKGGLISMQMWHIGRVAHASWGDNPFLKAQGRPLPTVSSSATKMPDFMMMMDFNTQKPGLPSMPRELTVEEIHRVADDYALAAKAAMRAGFDCVEIHGAHGYLIDQFLNDKINVRTDEFGGSIENRMRFMHLVVESVIKAVGTADRVGIRLSPTYEDITSTHFDCHDSDPATLYREAVKSLVKYNLAYLLLTEPRWEGIPTPVTPDKITILPLRNTWVKEIYPHKVIGAGGFTPAGAKEAIENGSYDAVAFGRWFISNPDLPRRLKEGLPLNVYERKTFSDRDPVDGYISYPFWGQENDPKFKRYELMEQSRIGVKLENTTPLDI